MSLRRLSFAINETNEMHLSLMLDKRQAELGIVPTKKDTRNKGMNAVILSLLRELHERRKADDSGIPGVAFDPSAPITAGIIESLLKRKVEPTESSLEAQADLLASLLETTTQLSQQLLTLDQKISEGGRMVIDSEPAESGRKNRDRLARMANYTRQVGE